MRLQMRCFFFFASPCRCVCCGLVWRRRASNLGFISTNPASRSMRCFMPLVVRAAPALTRPLVAAPLVRTRTTLVRVGDVSVRLPPPSQLHLVPRTHDSPDDAPGSPPSHARAGGGGGGADGDGGDDVPTTLPSGQSTRPSRPGTKYPVREIPHFDKLLGADLGKSRQVWAKSLTPGNS